MSARTDKPRLRLIGPRESIRRSFLEFAGQAADLSGRLARRGEIDGSLKALQVARVVLERVRSEEGER